MTLLIGIMIEADGGMRVWHFNGGLLLHTENGTAEILGDSEFGGESRGNKTGFYCIP